MKEKLAEKYVMHWKKPDELFVYCCAERYKKRFHNYDFECNPMPVYVYQYFLSTREHFYVEHLLYQKI